MFLEILILSLFSLCVIYLVVSFIIIVKFKKCFTTNKYLLSVFRRINRKTFAIDRNFYLYYENKATLESISELFVDLENDVREIESNLERFY